MRPVLLLVVSCILAVLLLSCSDVWDEDIRQIAFDSLSVPSILSSEDTLCISTYGIIGSDECWSFSHFDAQRDSFQIVISSWAKMRALHNVGCGTNIPLLAGKRYCTAPLFPGYLTVTGLQPDNTTIIKNVLITAP